MLNSSKTHVSEADVEACVVRKLNGLCTDLGVFPDDILWSQKSNLGNGVIFIFFSVL